MGERYKKCTGCSGTGFIRYRSSKEDNMKTIEVDCHVCDGQGFDGSAKAYLESEAEKDSSWQETLDAYRDY